MTRNYIYFYLNGEPIRVSDDGAFMMLADWLRKRKFLTGTKIVCAEGDCGACSVLKTHPLEGDGHTFKSFNSCITPVFKIDGCHIVTIDALADKEVLNPVQKCIKSCHGSQCGFCTPGITVALTQILEDQNEITEQTVKNHLTGNLCRCTGYKAIIDAGVALKDIPYAPLKTRFEQSRINLDLKYNISNPVHIKAHEQEAFIPTSIEQAVEIKRTHGEIRLLGSGTDLGVMINKGRFEFKNVMSLHHIEELYDIQDTHDFHQIGARATLTQIEAYFKASIPEISRFLRIFASPQIKNVATLAGNIANGSPIGDTLPFLDVLEARVIVMGPLGKRSIPFESLYTGYRSLSLKPDEFITHVLIPKLSKGSVLKLYKVSTRKDLDISTVNAGFFVQNYDTPEATYRISFGGVGPTVLRARNLETFLNGKTLNSKNLKDASLEIEKDIQPKTDVRGSENFRKLLAQNLLKKFALEVGGMF